MQHVRLVMLIETDEDDEWGDDYDYIFSAADWADYSRYTALMPDIPRAMYCLPVWPDIPEDEMDYIRSVAGDGAKIYTAQDIKLYDGHLMLDGAYVKSDLIDAPFGSRVSADCLGPREIADEEGENIPDYSQYLYLAIENLEDIDDKKYCILDPKQEK